MNNEMYFELDQNSDKGFVLHINRMNTYKKFTASKCKAKVTVVESRDCESFGNNDK